MMTPHEIKFRNRMVSKRERRADLELPLFDDDERDDEYLLIPKQSGARDRFLTHRAGKIENES